MNTPKTSQFRIIHLVILSSLFAAGCLALLGLARANNDSTSFEAEKFTSVTATTASDTNASSGKYIQFKNQAPIVIYDTDMGPDIDDVLALAMLHAYEKRGLVDVAAVTVSRNGEWGVRFSDALNTFYGRPDIPLGIFRGTTTHDSSDFRYTQPLSESGTYPHDIHQSSIQQGYKVMRKVLAESPDNSVIIVQVGFSSNTSDLLNSEPDEFSSLNGLDLVKRKAKALSIMAGDNNSDRASFNVRGNTAAAINVISNWPKQLIQTDSDLGRSMQYPLESIQSDFNYVANHIVKEAYLLRDFDSYDWHVQNGTHYDMHTWDLMSVIAAIDNPYDFFKPQIGTLSINSNGYTTFNRNSNGNHMFLGEVNAFSSADRQKVISRMIEMTSERP